MQAGAAPGAVPDHPDSPVLLSMDRGIARLTLNRPRRYNVLSEAMITALEGSLDILEAEAGVRVVVLAAAGKAFCSGHDLRELRERNDPVFHRQLFTRCARLMTRLRRLPQPVIARVHGVATAGGCQLVASCDLAVAGASARFAMSGIQLGLFCATPAVPLSRAVLPKPAFEMLVTGDFLDAASAAQRGLVNCAVADDQIDAQIDAWCSSILAKPAQAIAAGKQLFYRQLEMGVDAAYQLAVQTMALNFELPQAQERIDAFLGTREPPRS